ncbi:formylglycine-generating enzyme family protein [Snuella sedimenti]|uniref:Formylglycine-generating enzyme family protein n=1 Tax=Snuella sedimenti TaxID=2798802 RepID=A0A8J7LXV5_9FLAO|nr:formylglycine-generating enzyme family protein [Snuella sedimenti]MBJ6367406.1 formylglycine-generating enzyme family protein [Snuella sedimenti]
MKDRLIVMVSCIGLLVLFGCKDQKVGSGTDSVKNSSIQIEDKDSLVNNPPKGMVWIPSGTFLQGAVPHDQMAMAHEKPQHPVQVDGFFMDITEVTNAQFSKFVEATGYVTVAEREIDWEEMKKQIPEGTPKPHDSILKPGSLLFKKTKSSVPNLYDFSQWWQWSIGTNWRHPVGPDSTIEGKENYPVVHVAFEDAQAYCKWAGRRLPTEAEWEYAARGNKENTTFFWGNDRGELSKKANSWEGEFPVSNTLEDGFERAAPVRTYPPNGFGLYDMAGNVWEFTTDWYHLNYYKTLAEKKGAVNNPKGAAKAYNPNNPYIQEKVIKGGSFLCSDSYCASYRVSARMGTSMDSSAEHVGFRTVATPQMLSEH